MPVNTEDIVTSDKFKHSDERFKYFIGYQNGEIVKRLCIILPQISGYIKYFENSGKNMSFMVKDDNLLDKYNKILDKIKNKLNIKFHSKLVYDEKYIKTKVKEFDGKIRTNVLGNEVPKVNMHYTCIACIVIDSAMSMRMNKKNYPQVYLEQCKYKAKKIQMSRFISTELESESDSQSDSEAESKSDIELMAKLKSSSDSDSE